MKRAGAGLSRERKVSSEPHFILVARAMLMKRLLTIALFLFLSIPAWPKESLDPVISPALFRYDDEITVVYDVTGTPLANLANAWAWVWIPGTNTDALYNINPASADPAASDHAKFTKSEADGKTLFTLVFTPSSFFSQDIGDAVRIGILLKGNDWSDGQTTDYLADFWDGGFELKLTSPAVPHLFVDSGDDIPITAETPVPAHYELYVNEVSVDAVDNALSYSYDYSVTEVMGFSTVKLVATDGDNSSEAVFQYIIRGISPEVPRPAGIIPGINYDPADDTRVTLCLWAPAKSNAYVLGDFSDWQLKPENLMNRDGEYFWMEVSALVPGEEYGFQYLIEEALYLADPYADKILDPDDQFIPTSVYPELKQYPSAALHSEWYFNRIAVFQTGQDDYAWQSGDFVKPEKEDLLIYELLIRDFFANGERSYQNLMDTITYFKRLGVNAIELMPIMEFNGNEGWGYNPVFMFAPDKYYGTRDVLKAFVDRCHAEGIAVILDIAMNHQDIPNPYVMLDFDFGTMKPTANNKWFNTDATHPFNVFYDMNHESTYTQAYLDTVTYYWLNEYRIDGFRFDLSKGFTQTSNPGNVSAWSAYDASRIAIIKRMADAIWAHSPEAYVILEHFAANNEEKELAAYRADEGKGMLVWGNLNHAYNQNTMGYVEESDISWVDYRSRGWDLPHVVGYMESHDEERLMYRNLTYGNSSGSYTVKDLSIALDRIEAAEIMFYTIPGPKMLWQFGELGYDLSINRCEDGSISDNCRLSPKPAGWSYLSNEQRNRLFQHTADLIRLRNSYPVFTAGEVLFGGGSSLVKHLTLRNQPYTDTPADPEAMNAQVVANFGLTEEGVIVEFPHTGTWYDYYAYGKPVDVTSSSFVVNLQPGEYRLFTDVQIENPLVTGVEEETIRRLNVHPNPVRRFLNIDAEQEIIRRLVVRNLYGQPVITERVGMNRWDVGSLSPGLYVTEIETSVRNYRIKIIKQ